jgi:hypothetical protein
MMQIITSRFPSSSINPPTTGSTNINTPWNLSYWMIPSGSQGSTVYPSFNPIHAWNYYSSYASGSGSGIDDTQTVWGQQELILQDKWYHIALTWNKNNAPTYFINGRKYQGIDLPETYYVGEKPQYINFPYFLKGYITNLRVSEDVIYTGEFTPPQGENPYGFESGSTLFYAPLSASGDFSYIASGSKTIDISFV